MPGKESAVVHLTVRSKRARLAMALVAGAVKVLRSPRLVVPVANFIVRLWRLDVLANGKRMGRYRVRLRYDERSNTLSVAENQ